MKTANVQIGGIYQTRIGAEIATVVVVAEARRRFDYTKAVEVGTRRFQVRRLDDTKPLPSSRSAAALRECPVAKYTFKESGLEVNARAVITRGHAPLVGPVVDAAGKEFEPRTYEVFLPQFDRKVLVRAIHPKLAAMHGCAGLIAKEIWG